MTERVRPPVSKEPISFTPNLIGLQSRLLLGNSALNPSQAITERFNPDAITPFRDRNYSPFEAASRAERTDYWSAIDVRDSEDQIVIWSHTMSSLISNKNFSDSERDFYGRIGIDTDQFSAEDAANFYFHNFADKHNPLKSFVSKVIAFNPDHEALTNNINTITWFAHIFGSQSAEVVAQLIDAEIKFMTEPEIFTQDPDRINNLTSREIELLGFAWQHQIDTDLREPIAKTMGDANHEQVTLESNEIADRLVDYSTGQIRNNSIDLLPYYSNFVSNVQREIENDNPKFREEGPKLVLSELALTMIDKVATRANNIEQELAFSFNGYTFNDEDDMIATVAFIVPASDFVNTQGTRVQIDPGLNSQLNQQLLANTNLEDFFVEKTGISNGNNRGVLHIHHAGLDRKYDATPSPHDYRVVKHSILNGEREIYIWGVVTKRHDQLLMRVFCSKRNARGRVVHPEMKVIYESDLGEVLPIAA